MLQGFLNFKCSLKINSKLIEFFFFLFDFEISLATKVGFINYNCKISANFEMRIHLNRQGHSRSVSISDRSLVPSLMIRKY